MGYKRIEEVFHTGRCIRVRSNKKRKNHADICCQVEKEEDAKIIKKEIKKAVYRINHLLEEKTSFDLTIILESSGKEDKQ